MGKAKTFTPADLRRVLDYIATRRHAKRNRAMLLMTHYADQNYEGITLVAFKPL